MSTALAFIEPTDTGLIEELSKEIIRNGEKRLMLAVLESATDANHDATATGLKRSRVGE